MARQNLKDRIAVVTGAASGIGRATCQLFAEEGASVVLVDIDKASMEDILKGLSSNHDNKHCTIACDVSKADEIDAMFRMVERTFGKKCTILVNAAGINRKPALIDEITDDDFDKIINVNLKGTMVMARGFIKALKNSDNNIGGVIVNISSIGGKMSVSGAGSYCSSKFGVVGITKTIAAEYPTNKVRCNVILPGFVDTPMFRALDSDAVAKAVESIPIGRIAKPEEIANVCLFLASDRSSYVNGASLEVTGGLFA